MDFKISKPTLVDIPQMRNLIMPEVQKGIILDRTEDEMAGAIRSYSVVRIAESSAFCHSKSFLCHSERSEESKKNNLVILSECEESQKNNRDSSVATLPHNDNVGRDSSVATLPHNDNVGRDSSLRLRSAQNDKIEAKNDNFDARVAESSADSASSTHEANSAIADEFLGFCETSDEDRTLVHRGSELKRALRKQLAHTCKSLKSRCESEFAGEIVAFAALQILSLTLAEVRSLIVAPDFRRKGLATLLINHLLNEARALNIKEVLSLTYQREVFEKLGFKEIAKESLPNQKIWADCIKCKKFPVCDEIALLKTL